MQNICVADCQQNTSIEYVWQIFYLIFLKIIEEKLSKIIKMSDADAVLWYFWIYEFYFELLF